MAVRPTGVTARPNVKRLIRTTAEIKQQSAYQATRLVRHIIRIVPANVRPGHAIRAMLKMVTDVVIIPVLTVIHLHITKLQTNT